MEIENEETAERTEPCWPFWGVLQTVEESSYSRPGQLESRVMLCHSLSDIFKRFGLIGQKALRMLKHRSINELRDAASDIHSEIESFIDYYIEEETESLVKSLCERGGYQLGYLPEDARSSEYEVRNLLDNWSSEWGDASGLPKRDDFTDLEALSDCLGWNEYDEKEMMHFGLIEPEEHEFYAVLALMIICDAIHSNPFPIYPKSESLSLVKAIGCATINAIEAIAYADRIQFEGKIRKAIASEQPGILAAEIETRIKDREFKARQRLSAAGTKGAKAKNQLTNQLKVWALEQAAVMRGDDRAISRKLSAQIPEHLAEASKAPERFIYDALRTRNKPD